MTPKNHRSAILIILAVAFVATIMMVLYGKPQNLELCLTNSAQNSESMGTNKTVLALQIGHMADESCVAVDDAMKAAIKAGPIPQALADVGIIWQDKDGLVLALDLKVMDAVLHPHDWVQGSLSFTDKDENDGYIVADYAVVVTGFNGYIN